MLELIPIEEIMSRNKMTLCDFADAFDSKSEEFSESCRALIAEKDWGYEILEGKARDLVILEVLKRLEKDTQIIGSPERKEVWNNGWNENLENFLSDNCCLQTLIPKFFITRTGQPNRWRGNYILPDEPDFQYNLYQVYRQWIFEKYLENFDPIYEFGCGTGFNLVTLAELFPDKGLYGLDFVLSAVQLVNVIGETHDLKIHGYQFDMLDPDSAHFGYLGRKSAIFTLGVVEQLAGNFWPFLNYLLEEKPGICIHIEPTIELYDPNNLIDYLAIMFHRKRGYTEGFLPALQQLERDGEIEILRIHRPFWGDLMLEGYTLIVWRPL